MSETKEAEAPRWTEYLPLSGIKAAKRNPKLHGPSIASSIERFGYADGVIMDERTGRLVAGHGRTENLTRMRDAGQAPPDGVQVDAETGEWLVPVQRGWSSRSDAEAEAFLLAHNKTTEEGGWDEEQLSASLKELASLEVKLDGLGFEDDELKALIDLEPSKGPSDPGSGEEPPKIEPPDNPSSKPGEIYQLGPHRLFCGDCREAESYQKLFGEQRMHLVVTSPPYASQRDYDESSGFKPIPPDDYVAWYRALADLLAEYLATGGSYFLNIKEHCEKGERHLYVKDLTIAHKREWGWRFVDEFVWTHGGTPKAPNQRFKNGWEPIFQFTRDRHRFFPDAVMQEARSNSAAPDWNGLHPSREDLQGGAAIDEASEKAAKKKGKKRSKKDERKRLQELSKDPNQQGTSDYGNAIRDLTAMSPTMAAGLAYPSNHISPGKNREALGHSAAYPIGLPEFFVKAYTQEGDIVFDPFLGSGTTLIAAAMHGRIGYGMELSPGYCDVIRMRWTLWAESAGVDPGPNALRP